MKNVRFKVLVALLVLVGTFEAGKAMANVARAYPVDVACQLALETAPAFDPATINNMARTCNEFRVQNELEFNFVRGACVLGGTLSGLIYSFSEGQCDSGKAVALCRVAIQGTDLEEVTWYLEPEKQLGEPGSHENKFKASCDQLGGVFYKLNP
ncbi:MAG: hypothetical protein RI953_857 [Pseudomonadota bacterium]|jgi:1-aminocyclopropane-1-carboxylate deaminase/D-cysteine desulfhydrase-like pyridoxal-dependent ACC family enzyme